MYDSVPVGLRVIEIGAGCAMGEVHGCLALVWADQPTPEVMRLRADALRDLCERHPGHAGLVEIIEPSSKPPSDATRKVAMEVFPELGSRLSGIGFVIEGSDMRTAVNRAVITGMMFFIRQLQPTKVFKRQPDVLKWLAHRIGTTDPAFETVMISAIEFLRREMHQQRSRQVPARATAAQGLDGSRQHRE